MNIKEVTMYEAIDAMLIGLETIPNGSFKIDMTTFGNIDNNVCYGCAATCALQQLYDVRFTSDNIFGCLVNIRNLHRVGGMSVNG